MLIKEMPMEERPREKLWERGAEALSDAEILALFFGTGRQGMSVVQLARELITHFGGLRQLSRASAEELLTVKGIGPAKAAQLAAVFEFGRRLALETYNEMVIERPEDIFSLLQHEMQRLAQESVRVVLLNQRKRLIRVEEVFIGTGNESFANPAEILRRAIVLSAQSIILVHNHPSGDPTPSHADHKVTKRLHEASALIGIELVDHIIIGSPSAAHPSGYFSFREGGVL